MTQMVTLVIALWMACGRTAAGAYTVTLAWDPPLTYTDGSPAAPEAIGGYALHYGSTSQAYATTVHVGNVRSATLAGLTEGATYYLVASVYDTAGISSSLSAPEVVITPPPPTGETLPPVVTLTTPGNGTPVPRKATIILTANATDDTGVIGVVFVINGMVQCTVAAPPYRCAWQVPAPPKRTYVLQAKAYDAQANVGLSALVTVQAQ